MSQEMVLLIIMQIIENVILSTIFYQKGLRAVDKVWMTPCIPHPLYHLIFVAFLMMASLTGVR